MNSNDKRDNFLNLISAYPTTFCGLFPIEEHPAIALLQSFKWAHLSGRANRSRGNGYVLERQNH
jgi:hypothetical protein